MSPTLGFMRRAGVTTFLLLAPWHSAGARQLRGMPLMFEAPFHHPRTLEARLGHGGELDKVSMVWEATLHFGTGLRRRISVSAAGGIWEPAGDGHPFTGALGAQLWLNPGRNPNPFILRLISGVGVLNDAGHARWSFPIGVGAGYVAEVAGVHLEPWIVPHLTWRQGISANGSGEPVAKGWKASVSGGLTVGPTTVGAIRIAAECCTGGLSMAYGVSLWP